MRTKLLNSDFDAVIFDLDGTLVDSMWMWTDIDIEYLSRFGLKFEKKIQLDIAGMSIKETAAYFRDVLGVPQTDEQMVEAWISMSIEKYKHEVALKPHAAEFLEILKKNGVRTAIASSNAIEMIEACLEANSIKDKFDSVVTSNEVKRGKPYPDVYLYAAEKIGVPPERCLVFEDIPAGIMAAKEAGMKAVAVYDKYSEGSDREKHELADYYISDFGEFLNAEGFYA
ncbi:MAG: HAD family phosphatase [Eubacteriales bacterium]|nr:HAD family phosphatase [Eubacteriales bacterium]